MGPWMHASEGWGWMLGWHLLGWGLLALLVVALVVALTRSDDGRARQQDAAQILDERYARGEIDTDEYLARRETLR